MFENTKRQLPDFFGTKSIYLGTDAAFNEQVIVPLMSGTKKNQFKNTDAEGVTAAITCIKVLGDTISRLPINVYQKTDNGNQVDKEDYRYDLLHYSPDGIMTAQTFFGALEYQRNLKGNSFAIIHRNKISGKPESLEFLPSNLVGGYKIQNNQLYYSVYTKKGDKTIEKIYNSMDILHFKMITKNGYWGINPIEAQRINLSTLYKAKNTIDTYYENNAFSPKVLKSQIPDAQFIKTFNESMKTFKSKNVGISNAGEVIALPPFTEIQELSLDPIDAKFIESMKFDTTQVAAFYGVPPDMVGVYEYSKYSNVEQAQLNYRVNTLATITKMYRSELEMKLLTTKERKEGKSIEFVTNALMETDIATRLAYYNSLSGLGVITPNQIALLEGLETFEGGDVHNISNQTKNLSTEEAAPVVDASINE